MTPLSFVHTLTLKFEFLAFNGVWFLSCQTTNNPTTRHLISPAPPSLPDVTVRVSSDPTGSFRSHSLSKYGCLVRPKIPPTPLVEFRFSSAFTGSYSQSHQRLSDRWILIDSLALDSIFSFFFLSLNRRRITFAFVHQRSTPKIKWRPFRNESYTLAKRGHYIYL